MTSTKKPIVRIETNHGNIDIELYTKEVPKTCKNFMELAKKGYYDGTIFHRVIKDFMIQWGDPTGTGRGGESIYGEKFEDEFHRDLKNVYGMVSMANAGPNTNGSQFFIIHAKATPWLDNHHTVFGKVIEGMEVVDTIAQEQVDHSDRPLQEVKIIKMSVVKE